MGQPGALSVMGGFMAFGTNGVIVCGSHPSKGATDGAAWILDGDFDNWQDLEWDANDQCFGAVVAKTSAGFSQLILNGPIP